MRADLLSAGSPLRSAEDRRAGVTMATRLFADRNRLPVGRPIGAEAAALAVPEARIGPALREEFGMAAGFDDAAVIEHDQPIHPRDGREAMRDRDHPAAAH